MNTSYKLALAASVFLSMAAADEAGARSIGEACQGNACSDVSFVFSGGCHRITNHGSRRVRVHMGAISFGLERGQTWVLVNPFAPNTCVHTFGGGIRAYYT